MKDSPLKIFLLVLVTVLLLLPCQWLPALQVGNYEVKRIALLSDVLPAAEEAEAPALPAPPKPQAARRDSCPPGVVCIEDYEDASQRGMTPFFRALADRETLGRPVRIAYLGDSFIEADILTGSLRDLLQQRYGGHGVGFVEIAAPFAENRVTLRQTYGGWNTFSVLDKGKFDSRFLNLNGRYFTPRSTAWAELRGTGKSRLDSADVHTLYLQADHPLKVGLKLDDRPMWALPVEGGSRVQAVSLEERAGRARWQVPAGGNVVCWGAAEESRKGVCVDNYSLRGSSGMQLSAITDNVLRQYAEARPYDLIVIQYGLNVAEKKKTNYQAYAAQMRKNVERLKQCFPQAGFLIVSVGDREDRLADGELHTMPGVKALMRYQQNLAADCRVAFWNLYEGMGGEGGIRRMAEAKPAEAQKDYTHINVRGGRRVAEALFKAIKYGYEQYEKQ